MRKTASGTNLPKRGRFILVGFIWANASASQLELSQLRGAFRTCDKTAGKTCQNKPVPKWQVLLESCVDCLDQGTAHAGILERNDALDVKSVGNKSGNKIFIIQSIDRKMDFEDIARAKDLDFDELLTEIEGIVNSGTKLDISYYLREFMDEDKIEDIYLYFKEDAESDSLDAAIDELGADYTEEEIRLVRIKFMCEQGN